MMHPDRAKCYEYLKNYKTPKHVIGHCKSVAAVAYALGVALNEAGGTRAPEFQDIRFHKVDAHDGGRFYYMQKSEQSSEEHPWRFFDLELVLASALLHDMARVEDRHWDVAASFCKGLGLYQEEHIVRVHMQYEFTNDADHLTEADLVCLGDRLSLEDRYAGLDKRMDYIIQKAERRGNYDARPKILKKKADTRKLLDAVERRIGCSLDELLKDIDYENIEGINK